MREDIQVRLGERSYSIRFVSGRLPEVGSYVRSVHDPCRCAIITDENVAPLYGSVVEDSLAAEEFAPRTTVLTPGEERKNLDTMSLLYGRLVRSGLDRRSLVVALGGGVVGDIAGFAAATYMRGIPYLQVPTTLLSQVDSSVGGKTGVNLPEGKNLVGAFYQPCGVFADVSTLKTLPERELRAGMVEVIKYGIIADGQLFEWLEQNLDDLLALDPEKLIYAVRRCCEIKAEVVSRDETEQGLRAILNYGHTVGHAVESLTDYSGMLHGEAVSAGMVAAAEISHRLGRLSADDAERQRNILERLQTPTSLPAVEADVIMEKMRGDKKAVGGVPRFVLARRIGLVEVFSDVKPAEVREALLACGAAA